jgi:hypothetical protein
MYSYLLKKETCKTVLIRLCEGLGLCYYTYSLYRSVINLNFWSPASRLNPMEIAYENKRVQKTFKALLSREEESDETLQR